MEAVSEHGFVEVREGKSVGGVYAVDPVLNPPSPTGVSSGQLGVSESAGGNRKRVGLPG